MSATVIAVDVAKSVFEVAVSTRPAATVLMEACGTAHFWGRHAQAHGHRVVLLPPQAVRP